MGPLLFLEYIQYLGVGLDKALVRIFKFVDDSKVMTRINDEEDVAKLQNDLVSIYNWAGQNHMRWNDLKFQVLRVGPKVEIIENTTLFSPDFGEVVEAKSVIKDLGILVDDGVRYEDQLYKAVGKAKQKAAEVLTTFSTSGPLILVGEEGWVFLLRRSMSISFV